MEKYLLIGKTLFFPKEEILVIGDLHLGYEEMLRKQGITLPFNQLSSTKQEIKRIVKKIGKVKKIILLGDVMHFFNFDKGENFQIKDFLKFLEKLVGKDNLVLIRGNHDKFEIFGYNFIDYYMKGEIAFFHGNKMFEKLKNKEIKIWVVGHIHPAVWLQERGGVKREKFKAFLIGKFKKKNLIVVPSFFPLIEGTEINEEYKDKKGFSFIPKTSLQKLEVHVVGEDGIYSFARD
jgi:uncharacterized protein